MPKLGPCLPEAPCKVNGNTGALPEKLIYHIPKISQWSLCFTMFGGCLDSALKSTVSKILDEFIC